MRATSKQQRITGRSGFAIVVVLASLLILTTIFAIASQRSIAHIQTQSAERTLANRQANNAAILEILRDLGSKAVVPGSISLPPPFDDVQLHIQDTGGLIDLNTASPELLDAFFNAFAFPLDAKRLFRDWRREGRRLVRVDDVIRITDADPALLDEIATVATVFSGRRGIAPEFAPAEVLTILGGATPEAFISPPSNINFAVYSKTQLVGTISIPGPSDQSRILELH